jgi:hypothetical protein
MATCMNIEASVGQALLSLRRGETPEEVDHGCECNPFGAKKGRELGHKSGLEGKVLKVISITDSRSSQPV